MASDEWFEEKDREMDKLYAKLPKEYYTLVSEIVELNLEIEQECNI